jgi:hypothetical protein
MMPNRHSRSLLAHIAPTRTSHASGMEQPTSPDLEARKIATPAHPPAMPMTLPLSKSQAATEIKEVGVEGRPADAKAGPGRLMLEIALGVAIVAAFGVAFGLWLGWPIGIAVLAIGALGLGFNPVIGAVAERAKDRKQVSDRHVSDSTAANAKRFS